MNINPIKFTTGDFTGDNFSDIAVISSSTNVVSILQGNNDGTFKPKIDTKIMATPRNITSNDINNDGKDELIVTGSDTEPLLIFNVNADGSLQTNCSKYTGISPQAIIAEDITGDGNVDLAFTNSASNMISVLPGNGSGIFSSRLDYTATQKFTSIDTGDFNGDGNADLLLSSFDSNAISVLLGNGAQPISLKMDFLLADPINSIVTGRINNDNMADLLINSNGKYSILINTTTDASADIISSSTIQQSYLTATSGFKSGGSTTSTKASPTHGSGSSTAVTSVSVVNKKINILENNTVQIDVGLNDPTNIMTLTELYGSTHGSVSLENNLIVYSPHKDFIGKDTFNYTLTSPKAIRKGVVEVTILPVKNAPVLSAIPDQTISEGQSVSISLSAADIDGDTLTFSASNLPAGATLDPTTGAFQWKPDYTQAGSYTIHFSVSDGTLNDTKDCTIIVNDVPPVQLFFDGFESKRFSLGKWSTSKAVVTPLEKASGSYCAQLLTDGNLTKSFSTSSITEVVVKYNRKMHTPTFTGHFISEWYDGAKWNTLEDLTQMSDWTEQKFILTSGAFNNSNFKLRFRTSRISPLQFIDNVEILGIKY